MKQLIDIDKITSDVEHYFSSELMNQCKAENWTKDSQWTNGIQSKIAEIGHSYNFRVFASENRCPMADGPEWLYDQHWRIESEDKDLLRIPLVMEIEWGFGASTIFEKIKEDFLKLVQARTDLRVMVFQCNDVDSMIDKLISMIKLFDETEHGDRWIFAGYGWDTHQIHCKLWNA